MGLAELTGLTPFDGVRVPWSRAGVPNAENGPERRAGNTDRSVEREKWSRPWDSNPRPTDYESVALPAELERQLKTTTTDTSCLTTPWQGCRLQGPSLGLTIVQDSIANLCAEIQGMSPSLQ
jgi:hypothetical protein